MRCLDARYFQDDTACATIVDSRYDQAGGYTSWMNVHPNPQQYPSASLRSVRRDVKPTAHCPLTCSQAGRCNTSPSLVWSARGQRSSSTLPSQTPRLNKRYRLRSPIPSPVTALGSSPPSRLHSIPSLTRRSNKWFRLNLSPIHFPR